MNNKVKTIVYISVFALLIIGASFAYNRLNAQNQQLLDSELQKVQTKKTVEESETITAKETTAENEITEEDMEEEVVMAPDFVVVDVEGNEVKFSDQIGKPIVINFWASWCPRCKGEMPDFEEVYLEMGDEITFMMVDLVDPKGGRETKEKGQEYIEKEGFTFPVYFDVNQEAAYTYGVSSIPASVFINSEGEIVAAQMGALTKDMLLQGIGMIQDNVVIQ